MDDGIFIIQFFWPDEAFFNFQTFYGKGRNLKVAKILFMHRNMRP